MKKTRLTRFCEVALAAYKKCYDETATHDAEFRERVAKAMMDGVRAELGGKHISIPGTSKDAAANRNARIVRDKEAGVPVPVIMDKYGLSRAAVYKILKKRN